MAFPGAGTRARGARRVVAVAACVLVAAPASASAAILVSHSSVSATETAGNGDGLISPGDTFNLSETIRSDEPGTITGVSGRLDTTTPGVTVNVNNSPYPNLDFGQLGTNTNPFSVTLEPAAECGIDLALQLNVTSDQGSGVAPFALPTGTAGPFEPYASTVVPVSIVDNATVESTLDVPTAGRIKDLEVRLGRIQHETVSDLRIELVPPDGPTVVLVDRQGGSGNDFVDTVFDDDGAAISSASAPFTGRFRPEDDLARLNGRQQQGTWRLRITDFRTGDTGTLVDWGADVAPALCSPFPVASFTMTPNPVPPGQTVAFDGSASTDPNGTIARYQWDLDGDTATGVDGGYEVDGGASPTTSRSYSSSGAVSVRLRVTDNSGDSASRTMTLRVTQPPTARVTATPESPLSGQTVTLDGSTSSDPDGTVTRYEWDLNGDGVYERDGGSSPTLATSFSTPGTKTVGLRVTDDLGAKGTATIAIAVANRAPTASFTAPSPVLVGVEAVFNASGSTDVDGTIARYEWDLDGNGSYETDTATSSVARRTYTSSASVNVGLRVTDNLGATATKTVPVKVTWPPTASFTVSPNPAAPGQVISFNAAGSSDPDGTIVRHQWDLDGNGVLETDTGTTTTATRTYTADGTYRVMLRVTDSDGATATKTVDVLVSSGLPTARLLVTPNPANVGQPVELDGSTSSDPDGLLVKYDWDLDGNGTYETTTGPTPRTTVTYPNPGTFSVGLRVTDDTGLTSTRSVSLSVLGAPSGSTTTGSTSGTTSGGTTGGTTTGGIDTGTVAGVGAAFRATLGGRPIQKLRSVLRKGVGVVCESNRAAKCTVKVLLGKRDARRLRIAKRAKRPVVIGKARVSLRGAGKVRLSVKLNKRARRALRKAKRLKVSVSGAAIAGGERAALGRVVLLRR